MGRNIFMTILGFLSARIYERFLFFYHGEYCGYQKQLIHDISVTANYNVNAVKSWKEIVGTISFSQTFFISTKVLKENLFGVYFGNKINNVDQFFLSLGKEIYRNTNLYNKLKVFSPDNTENRQIMVNTINEIITCDYLCLDTELSSLFFEELSYILPERKAKYDLPPKIFGEGYYI